MRQTLVWFLLIICLVIASCDFNRKEPPVTTFSVIGDRTGNHLYDNTDTDIHQLVLNAIAKEDIDFAITVGDMIEGYTEHQGNLASQWEKYFSLYDSFPAPVYFTPGNHDLYLEAQLPLYKQLVGDPYYSMTINNLHLVILDNSRWAAGKELLDITQYNWLKSELESNRDKLTIIFCHIPYWNNSISDNSPTDSLHQLFLKHHVKAVFAGHYHAYYMAEYDGITYTIAGRSGGKTTRLNPHYKPADSRYSTPDYEPHRYLMVHVIGDSIAISNHPIAVEEKTPIIGRPL